MPDHLVQLDDYEVANLRELLIAMTATPSVLNPLANGDWTWQVLYKLPKVEHPPNNSSELMQSLVKSRVKWELEREADSD